MKSTLFVLATLNLFNGTANAKGADIEAYRAPSTAISRPSAPADTGLAARPSHPGFLAGSRTQTNVYGLFGGGGFAQGGQS